MKLIIASNIKNLAKELKEYNIVATVNNSTDLLALFNTGKAPCDVLLVSEKFNVRGSLIDVLINLHMEYPEVRIIYLANGNLNNTFNVNQFYALVDKGIYDIYYGEHIKKADIINMIEHPRTRVDCADIINAKERLSDGDIQETAIMNEDVAHSNVYTVTSVKPGTGKSFVSSNLAITIAKYGKDSPKVLLLEGDLQTLSVATLFGIKNDTYNLKTALGKLDNYLANHSIDDWYDDASEIKEFIDNCCLKTGIGDLYILEGHDFGLDNVSNTASDTYYYLVDYLSTRFDYVIVDANSSFQHPTTDPLFQISNILYFVFTTDYANIRLNARYQEELERLGVISKVKYVLNKSLNGDAKNNFAATFQYDDDSIITRYASKLRIDYDVPLMDMAVILNATFRQQPIATDETFKTLSARIAFIKIARDILPLENVDKITGEVEALEKQNKKKLVDKDYSVGTLVIFIIIAMMFLIWILFAGFYSGLL